MFLSIYRPIVGVFLLLVLSISGCGHGGDGKTNEPNSGGPTAWLIPPESVIDGGPGRDGIPALDDPQFESATTITNVLDTDLVVVVSSAGQVKAYPHDIMDYHEIVNDGPMDAPFTLSYCPLTGSAIGWHGSLEDPNRNYGVSGLLYNSNLMLFDRASSSLWSQMLQISVTGAKIGVRPAPYTVLEMQFSTLKVMYPEALVMTRVTGHTRDYDSYPYGDYRQSTGLLFPVNGQQDNRRHPKERVIGIHDANSSSSKVYQLGEFGDSTLAINDQFAGQSIVVVGNSSLRFAAIYSSELADGTILSFDSIQDDLPNVLLDTEGNVWDVFGTAVSGVRAGEQLQPTMSYVAMWFAWVAHFDEVQLHFN